jgi:hypothetical protein
MIGKEKYEIDYVLYSNDMRLILFKYNSRKRLKKELRSVFNTNSFVVLEKRLDKYNLKVELITRTRAFDYYEITTKNIYGGRVKMNNNGMKIKFNLSSVKGNEE